VSSEAATARVFGEEKRARVFQEQLTGARSARSAWVHSETVPLLLIVSTPLSFFLSFLPFVMNIYARKGK
jgi:hypothetical protein